MKQLALPLQTLVSCVLTTAAVGGWALRADGQERFRRTPPLPDSFRELRLPAIESFSLSNGLTVAVTSRPGSPIVSLQVIILAGEADSPAELPHVATLTARMIGHGVKDATRNLSADDMENMIEALGGDFSVTVSTDYTVLTLHVPAEFQDRALDLLKLMVLQPEFSDLEVTTAKRVFSYGLRDMEKNAAFVGRRQLFRALFEGHPYKTSTYSWDVIRHVTPKHLEAFYGRFYRPNNAIIAVSGDVDGPATAQRIGQKFASWIRQNVDRPSLPPLAPNNKERVCFIDLPTSEDFEILVGNLTVPPTSPDYYPFLVLNQVLGGTMGSRLFMNLRESKGYAYDAFSGAEFFRACGVFWASAKVTPQATHAAVQEINKELRALRLEKVVPEEIERAKSFLIGNLPLKFESLESYSEKLAQVAALGLGSTHWNKASDSLMLVDADKVLEVAQRCFPPIPLVVIVGNREWALRALSEFEAVDVYDSTGAFRMTLRKGVEK
jgi:predicted Zn-dependent peptidase